MPKIRTFTDRDVIRIFNKHLDPQERKLVLAEICKGQGPALFTQDELEALSLTAFQTTDFFGPINIGLIVAEAIVDSKNTIDFEWAQVATHQLYETEDAIKKLRLEIPNNVLFHINPFNKLDKILSGIQSLLKTIRGLIEPMNTLFLIVDFFDSQRVAFTSFRTTVAIWSDKVE